MRRETQNVLLILLGGALLKISLTGSYLRYVKPSHQWLLIAAGAVMVLLAAVSIARDIAGARRTADPAAPGGHQHSMRGAWLLLLPVLAVFVVAPPALGADAALRASGNRASEDGSALFPPLPAGAVISLPLSDFVARAAWDTGESLADRPVRLTGFVVHDRDAGPATYLARIAIGCCSADGFPIKVRLEHSQQAATLPDDTWLEVVATVIPGTATKSNDNVPSATVTELREIPQPEDPYEH